VTGDPRVVRGVANGAVWIGDGAEVEGRVEDTVVGRGARVPRDADLSRVVVWDGVEVPAGAHRDAVFSPNGKVALRARR
jgi:ADP-glucose pyrophosphorylase